jgi:hypothetical protein
LSNLAEHRMLLAALRSEGLSLQKKMNSELEL